MPANHPIFQGTFLFGKKLLAVNISKNYQERHAPDGRGSTYECARKYWRLSKKRAEGVDYVIAVADGRVVGIYRPKNWSASKEVPGKFEFEGEKIRENPIAAADALWVFAGRSNPVRYMD